MPDRSVANWNECCLGVRAGFDLSTLSLSRALCHSWCSTISALGDSQHENRQPVHWASFCIMCMGTAEDHAPGFSVLEERTVQPNAGWRVNLSTYK